MSVLLHSMGVSAVLAPGSQETTEKRLRSDCQ